MMMEIGLDLVGGQAWHAGRSIVAGIAESTAARVVAQVGLVHAAFDPPDPTLADLVPHGVGQCLDGVCRGDAVAVEVEQRVQLDERLSAVAAEDAHTGRSQHATPDVPVLGRERSQRRLPVDGGSTPVGLLDNRPQGVAELLELIGDGDTVSVELEELSVSFPQLVEEVEAMVSELGEFWCSQPRGHSIEERAARWVRDRWVSG